MDAGRGWRVDLHARERGRSPSGTQPHMCTFVHSETVVQATNCERGTSGFAGAHMYSEHVRGANIVCVWANRPTEHCCAFGQPRLLRGPAAAPSPPGLDRAIAVCMCSVCVHVGHTL